MSNGLVFDVTARIKGYQESIKEMQAAFSKVDPGSEIGKKISRAIDQANKELNALSKNMTPKVTSDSQIDNYVEKVNHLGTAVQRVGQLMQQVGTNDLNLSAFDGSIGHLTQQLQQLQAQLQGNIDEGIRNTIASTTELAEIFSQLKININGKTRAEIFDAIAQKAKEASKAAAEADNAVQKAQQTASQKQASLDALKDNPLNDPKTLESSLKGVAANYTDAIEQIKASVAKGLNELLPNDKGKQEQLLQGFMGGLTPETLKNHAKVLKDSLQAELGNGMKAPEIFSKLFSGVTEANNNSYIISEALKNKFFPPEAMETLKNDFSQRFMEISQWFTDAQQGKIKTLINEGDIEGALKTTLDSLHDAYQRLQTGIVRESRGADEAIGKLTEAQATQTVAHQQQSQIDTTRQTLESRVVELENENKNLRNRLDEIEKQQNEAKNQAAAGIRGAGAEHQIRAGQLSISADEALKYKNALDQVHAKEQMIGKLQGVVQRWFSIYSAIRMVSKAIHDVINTIKELDKTITEIAIVTDMTQGDLWGQMESYTEMARQYASSISGVYKVSQLYYQQGLQTVDVMALTEQTLKMARISGLDYATATDYMTNAVRSFKMEMTDAQTVVDVYSAVAANSATSVSELANAMSKTASSAQAVGSSFENTTAMMAVMIEATRESSENIGSALKSIISRYGEMKADPSKLIDSEGEAMSLNKVDTALQSVGISIHNAAGQFRDFDDVIMELAESWDKIDVNTQRYIATVMAGNR